MTYLTMLLMLPRKYKVWLMRLLDALVLTLAYCYISLIHASRGPINLGYTALLGMITIAVAMLVLNKAGFYRWQVRFLNFTIFNSLFLAMVSSGLAFIIVSYALYHTYSFFGLVSYFALGLIGLLGVRAMLMVLLDSKTADQGVILVGTSNQSIQFAQALQYSSHRQPVAFIDDNEHTRNTVILGIPVYPLSALTNVVEKYAADYTQLSICVTNPSFSYAEKKLLLAQVAEHPVHIQYLSQNVDELMAGTDIINSVKDFEITELLGRDAIPPQIELMQKAVYDQVVMVTGAGGSIGSEIVLQIAKILPKKIVLVDSSEFALYQIQQQLLKDFPTIVFSGLLVDVKNEQRVREILLEHQVDVIFHAAAYKHVPIVEDNMIAGLENNIQGTESILNAINHTQVKRFTLISTDKAVRPTNIMGATKRMAELLVCARAQSTQNQPTQTDINQTDSSQSKEIACQSVTHPQVTYSIVRFGNVLGSSGSVVPLFKQQIMRGGPVTVTHKEVTRFFMTISEAAQLVIQSSAQATSGDIFLLDMGESVKIYDLAKRMIHIMGYQVKDARYPTGIEIKQTGLRKGEKLYEELLIDPNGATKTQHPRIFKATEELLDINQLQQLLADLYLAMAIKNYDQIKALLSHQLVNYGAEKPNN